MRTAPKLMTYYGATDLIIIMSPCEYVHVSVCALGICAGCVCVCVHVCNMHVSVYAICMYISKVCVCVYTCVCIHVRGAYKVFHPCKGAHAICKHKAGMNILFTGITTVHESLRSLTNMANPPQGNHYEYINGPPNPLIKEYITQVTNMNKSQT